LLNGFHVRNDVGCFTDALALSGEDCLIDAEATGRDREQSAVRRDFITDRDEDYIAWDKLGGMNSGSLASPKDFGFVGRVLLESLR
jgi:hypothetical protein